MAVPQSIDPPLSGRDRYVAAIHGTKGELDQLIKGGLHAYTNYLEHQISTCVFESVARWSEVFEPGARKTWVPQIFNALTIVTTFLYTCDSQSSLNDIVQHLSVEEESWRTATNSHASQHQIGNDDHNDDNDSTILRLEHHLVFACLGWASMLFTPFHDFSHSTFQIIKTNFVSANLTNNAFAVPGKPDIHRPMGTMLRKMGLLPIMCPAMPPVRNGGGGGGGGGGGAELASFMKVSTLCYSSLHQIGGVSILWINNLLEHCQFDAKRQELKLFRFPGYCLHSMNAASDVKILEGILTAHTCVQSSKGCKHDLPKVIKLYLREVLISYRLLFGQEKKSRKLFRSRESIQARFRTVEDPVLQALCGRKQPSLLMKYLNIDAEKSVYDAYADFPFLGERLLQLYNYNASQTPSPWRSLFLLDPRDSTESVNFFLTIVVVGGISITLSLIQTVVAIIALVGKK